MFVLLATLIVLLSSLFLYFKWCFRYWKSRNVPVVLPPKIPFGTAPNLFHRLVNIGELTKQMYDALKARGLKYGGGYSLNSPIFLPVDLALIRNILQKDFDHFTERGFYYNEKDDPLSANLFALGGTRWKHLRAKLSPAFSSGKIRTTFAQVLECGEEMEKCVGRCRDRNRPVDIKEVAACYTTDVIGACGFGLKCNSLTFPDAEFRRYGKRAFEFDSLARCAKVVLGFGFPRLAKIARVSLFDADTTDFFMGVVRDTVKFRREEKCARNDFLQLLIDSKFPQGMGGEKISEQTVKELAAQVFIFFAAGFETSSTTLTYCLFELAAHPEIQTKLRSEINSALVDDLTYDTIMEMKYLNQVVEETLRKYPPVSYITRQCAKDYQIPGTSSLIEKGIVLGISILGLHHDPDYYPNPELFDPERFSEQNKRNRIPMTYMPFGDGPRICIGLRFGLMQTKVGLVYLLRNYEFSLNPKTKLPLGYDPFSFTLLPKSDIFLDVT